MSSQRPRQPLRPAGSRKLPPAMRKWVDHDGANLIPGANPGGQPKRQRSVAKAIRELLNHNPTGLVALLLDIAEDEKARDSDRIAAIRELLDRGYGKAPEHAPIQDGDPLEMGTLEQAIAELLGRRNGHEIEAREVRRELPSGTVEAGEDTVEVGERTPEPAG